MRISTLALYALLALGCSGGTDSDSETDPDSDPDPDPDTDTDIELVDQVGPNSACTINGYAPDSTEGLVAPGRAYAVISQDSNTSPVNTLRLEVIEGAGGPPGPFSHTFDGENYESCVICLTGLRGCTEADVCEQSFLSVVGDLDVTEASSTVGATVKGTATGLKLFEAVIDEQTLKSRYVKDGDVWCVDRWAVDVTLVEPS